MVKDTTTTPPELNMMNFLQVAPMTFEEKVRMYMKCSKLELAKMLAERDRLDYVPQPQPYPAPNTAPWPTPRYNIEYEITCDTDPLATQSISVSDSTGNTAYCSSTWI